MGDVSGYEENGICGMKCMEFLPRTKQRVMFYLCRTFVEFLVEFTKYNLSEISPTG